MKTIYLDYNATTPIDPAVAETMRPFLDEIFGNPSSIHAEGIRARQTVETARRQVAGLLNCQPDEIIFTSGGTESNNLAIKGIAYASLNKGNHIITSSTEHPSVLEVCHYLENHGFKITYLPVDENGQVNPGEVERNITPVTILVTIMHANNETGSIQPIEEIGKITSERGIPFHTDAAQSAGKIDADVQKMGVSLLSLAGHKIYAPKGVGALYIRRGTHLEKLIHGADHEQNLRAGTENIMSVAGLGKACEIAASTLSTSNSIRELRDFLEEEIRREIPETKVNGHPVMRLPNTLNISFPSVEAGLLLERMSPVAASAGAACHSASEVISPVLFAMNVPAVLAMGSVRFSIGRMTTKAEIEEAIPLILKAYRSQHSSSGIRNQPTTGIKLTNYTHGQGCACKIRPEYLEKILAGLPLSDDPDVLVGLGTNDDAAVYRINEKLAVVQTVDFFTPVVDDPYYFGAIAAANSLSDIYAMGGKPSFALSIVGFPEKLLPADVLKMILKGASDKAAEAGINIIGGHSIEDNEPKFGLVVTGFIDPGRILVNSNAKPGDSLILTKPIGTGILSTAIKRGLTDPEMEKMLVSVMAELNAKAAGIMSEFPVNACTDITGFGLLGHLKEMITGSKTGAILDHRAVPVIPPTWHFAAMNMAPGGTINNLKFVEDIVDWDPGLPKLAKMILADAQTSGGLLISLPERHSVGFIKECRSNGISEAAVIGKIVKGDRIIIR